MYCFSALKLYAAFEIFDNIHGPVSQPEVPIKDRSLEMNVAIRPYLLMGTRIFYTQEMVSHTLA